MTESDRRFERVEFVVPDALNHPTDQELVQVGKATAMSFASPHAR
jgi:hypothetical protein